MTINVKDWQKQRNSLDETIADDAVICEVYDSGKVRMDTINKWEFINLLTRMTGTRKDVQIIEKREERAKITYILFREVEKLPGR
jgi:hypothetical protein